MSFSLPNFLQAKVLVVGDVMLDRYWGGSTQRISPEAPVPVVHVDKIEERLGGAANVALNLATLGASVTLAGLVGRDENGKLLSQKAQEQHIDVKFVQAYQCQTITKLRVLSSGQQLLRLDFEKQFSKADSKELSDLCLTALPDYDILVLSDYNKGSLGNMQVLIQAARALAIPVLVDPKAYAVDNYRHATLLTPNMKEFQAMVGLIDSEVTLHQKAQALMQQLDLEALLITRSEKGMTLVQRDQPLLSIPTLAQEVFDVTGAGDTVIAALAGALAAGADLLSACQIANLSAGVVVGKVGTSAVSQEELQIAIEQHAGLHQPGVVSEEMLEVLVKQAQAQGKKVVLTNGCFDLLHAGHVRYLEQAKALGDKLVVAVNTDASVRALKGDSRPVNTCLKRMSVLAALGSVDWVVSFSEATPLRLINQLTPDFLVKGGDYQAQDIVGYAEVLAYGGVVKVLDFQEDCSTTRMIQSILEKSL
jgi:D-beta-D-heptose 7-phosphate kinase/D-beta-D-heptose 1-phosphate adenosyltransferase